LGDLNKELLAGEVCNLISPVVVLIKFKKTWAI